MINVAHPNYSIFQVVDHVKTLMDLPEFAETSLTPGSKEYDLFRTMSTSSKQKKSRCVHHVINPFRAH